MLYGAGDDDPQLPGDQGIVQEAFQRWTSCNEWQGTEDERGREDLKFANADPVNGAQWPSKLVEQRTGNNQDRPCLTVNVTRVHNDLVINQMAKNRFGIKIKPTGGRSSYESAQVMQSIIRRIEYISKASSAYRKVSEHQVDGGIGYILIETAYVNPRTNDQDIYLRAARDPFAVYLDPWIREEDGSDANFGFIFEKMSRKQFNRKYPDFKDRIGQNPFAGTMTNWLTDKEIVVVKYYRKKEQEDTLIWYVATDDATGAPQRVYKLKSEILEESGKDILDQLLDDIENGRNDGGTRPTTTANVEWFLIGGDLIVDRGDWAGSHIPICRCVGHERVMDGTLDRKGMTRPQIDAQRILNYSVSADIETGALQTRAPYVAPARALEGQEQWKTLNTENYPVLTYNDIDEEAPVELQKIERPVREPPPQPSPAFQASAAAAERWHMMITGQFQAQLGENDQQSAISGKAINERQQQSDLLTSEYPEHQSEMLRFIGVQLLDLIPKIYDTERALHVIDDRGDRRWIKIVPDQSDAVEQIEERLNEKEAITTAFNPSIGEYECVSDPGPDYATQRQEAFNAISQILAQNRDLVGIVGDIFFQNSDFPAAEDLRDRLKKFIKATKPFLFDDSQDPAVTQLQQQIQKLTELNTVLMSKLAISELSIKGRDEKRDVEAYRADSDRMKVVLEWIKANALTEQQRAQMDHDLERMAHQHVYDVLMAANRADLQPVAAE